MNTYNTRVCNKCKKILNENEAYCTYCGTLSAKPPRGIILIRPDKIKLAVILFIIAGILLGFLGIKMYLDGFNSIEGIIMGLGLVFIVIGIPLNKVNSKLVCDSKKKSNLTIEEFNYKHCKYCGNINEINSNYCFFCGSKIKK